MALLSFSRLLLLVALACLGLCTLVACFRIEDLGAGVDGSQNTLFNIDFVSQLSGDANSPNLRAVTMRTGNNENYDCFVPVADPSEQKAETTVAPVDPATLFSTSEPCFILMEPYWTYEFCPNRHIRQFHKREESVSGVKQQVTHSEFFLGRAVAGHSSPALRMPHKGEQLMYTTQTFGGGTPCDLTGQPRETVVHFVCGALATFADVSETSTCRYAVVIESPSLCHYPGYAIPKRGVERIQCVAKQPIIVPRALQEIQDQQVEAARVAAEARASTNPHATAMVFEDGVDTGARTVLPVPPEASGAGQTAAQPPMGSAPAAAASKEMLRRMLKNNHCFIGGDGGWWKFEFCFHRHVRQFHVNEDGTTASILLGTWDEAHHREQFLAHRDEAVTKRSVSQYFNKGDFCDETKQPRQTQVRLVCSRALSPSQVALALTEPATCRYVLTAQSQLFCDILDTVDANGKILL